MTTKLVDEQMFGYNSERTDAVLERLLARYERYNSAIPVDFRKLVPSLSSADRATHLLHPYPAKLLTHIPFFFLANRILSHIGETVLDPFCGSGTVLLESRLAGRVAAGADSNPFARMLTRVKTTPLPMCVLNSAMRRLIDRIPSAPKGALPDVVNLDYWFYPHVARQLQCISEAIQGTRRRDVQDFFWISFSKCARAVSLADPRLSVPVRLRSGQYPKGHFLHDRTESLIRRLRRVNVVKVFTEILQANFQRMATIHGVQNGRPSPCVVSADARHLANGSCPGLPTESVQLVITSPPYPGAQKYIRSCSFGLGWLGLCTASEIRPLKLETIGREEISKQEAAQAPRTDIPAADRIISKIRAVNPVRAAIAATYLMEMDQSIRELARVTKPGGYFVLVAANNEFSGYNFRTQQYLRVIAHRHGFRTVLRLVDTIRSRGLMTKRNRTASMITREWVLVLRKDA